MPEEQIKDIQQSEPVVDVPTEGDPVDIELKDDKTPKEQPTGTAPEVEVTTTEKEELDDYSEKVKGRINKLTGKLRETERREQASFDYAKRVAEENKKLKGRLNSLDESYIDEYKARTEAQTAGAKVELQKAIEAGDVEAQVTAQEALSKLAVDNQRVLATTQAKEQQKVQGERQVQQPTFTPPKKPDPKAEAWAEKNSWFGTDEAMTYASFGIHRKLVEQEGFDANSDEYYTEIDKRIRQEFPHKFSDGGQVNGATKPVQSVASAGRSTTSKTSGRKTVRLTPSQVHIAKRLGVPLEEYAKYVKE
jgi:hypothetical protein